jgi:hypothetical protein
MFRKTWFLAVLLVPTFVSADQTLTLYSSSCSKTSDGQTKLSCNHGNSDKSCTVNSTSFFTGGTCGQTSDGRADAQVTNSDGSTTTTSCSQTATINDDCNPMTVRNTTESSTSQISDGGDPSACDQDLQLGAQRGFCEGLASPIIIPLDGDAVRLTSVENGVMFDLKNAGLPRKVAWTEAGTNEGFLVLDRDLNGRIDTGNELFGNFTPQPESSQPNGFLALGVFDRSENGGNGDGRIDKADTVYSSLRIWIDANHNGISEPDELLTLPQAGIEAIDLKYEVSRRKDGSGNQFRFRSRVKFAADSSSISRWAYDVFLQIQ